MQDPNFKIPPVSSEILNSIKTKFFNIAYCDESPSQKLDIYYPTVVSDDPYPVIIHFHGGAFMIGTKGDDALEPMLRGLDRGYAVVSVDYRLSGEARFPAMVYDAKTAIRFLRANAQKLHLNPDAFAAWGASSGAWLVSMLAVTDNEKAFEDKSMGYEKFSSRVNAVVDWCGPCGNFLEMDKAFKVSKCGVADHDDSNSPESLFLGHKITQVSELCRLSAPISYASANSAPILIVHGSIDEIVPVEQSVNFYKALQSVGADSRLYVAEGKLHHGHPWYHEKWLSDMCLDFLDKYLK